MVPIAAHDCILLRVHLWKRILELEHRILREFGAEAWMVHLSEQIGPPCVDLPEIAERLPNKSDRVAADTCVRIDLHLDVGYFDSTSPAL